ncbi:hypothetical protein H6G80_21615 [Nostoc sp. FACHB-87]|uniref:hypothetical protein n=1 Tax=Nostocaceae TaxID=1162 RepID=UPI001683B677|nr:MULTISPECIES: hypothetical protein [Nostocaceae]MBD2456665.1 hypothetical protein [Nostoc sp. FACHB-87]MBD2478082.1 hypothetical protein [Anabaena sp. FACHB-83]
MSVDLLILSLICASFFACVSMQIAQGKGRNAALWLVLGFLFGIFAVILVAILPTA